MWGWCLESRKPQKHGNLFLGRNLNLNDSHCKVQTPCQYLPTRRTMISLLQQQFLFGCCFRPFLSSPSSSWSSFSSILEVCSAQADTPQKCCNERASKAPILQSSLPSHLFSLSSQMDGEQHLFGQSSNSILRHTMFHQHHESIRLAQALKLVKKCTLRWLSIIILTFWWIPGFELLGQYLKAISWSSGANRSSPFVNLEQITEHTESPQRENCQRIL